MNIIAVTRHRGAVEWLERNGYKGVEATKHLPRHRIDRLQPGDVVVGTLPVHLIADICHLGAEYWHLAMHIPAELRGAELSADDMDYCGCRLQRYTAHRVGDPPAGLDTDAPL